MKSIDGGATWTAANTGIPSTAVWSIVPDPVTSGVVYVATGGAGAFKSVDGGTTWSALPLPAIVNALAIDPGDPAVLYAGGNGEGVCRSTDSSASFSIVGSPEVGVVVALAVDPADSQRVVAGTVSGGVAVSDDGGATWTSTNVRRTIAAGVTITSDGTVYVGTSFSGAFVSRTRHHGGTHPQTLRFDALAEADLQAIKAQNVYSLSVDPSDSNHLLLGTNDGGVIASHNGGRTWRDVGRGFLSRASRRAVFDPANPARIYAGSFSGGGLYRSDDGGETWSRHLFGSSTVYVWATGINPFSGAVYGGTNGEGLWRSADGARTFTRVDGGRIPQVRDIAFDTSADGTVYVASLSGLWRSTDGATTFTRVLAMPIFTVSIDPTDSMVVYAGTRLAGVFKSTDGGITFTASNVGLTNLRTSRGGGVAIDPTDPLRIYVGTEGGGVFHSNDGGATWSPVNVGLTDPRVLGLTMDPAHPNGLYACGPSGVFKTETGGQ